MLSTFLKGSSAAPPVGCLSAWGWGRNAYGQTGDNTIVIRSSPVQNVTGFIDWCQVSAGGNHSLGVRQSGTAWAWARNGNGQLGDNTLVNKSSPVLVAGGFTDWCQLSAGGYHSLGTRQNGTARAWGFNNSGQLGDGTTVAKSSPVLVVGGFTNWCQVSAGGQHSLGVRTNGTAWAWGIGTNGRLGDNTAVNKSSPVGLVGGFINWCQVSAGNAHSLGLRTTGTAWAWGNNAQGRLGDNTTVAKSSPVQVVGGFTDWCQVSAGNLHSLGLRTNGTAWSWGCNSIGQLGNNSTINRSSPGSVVGGFTNWCQVSTANIGFHSLGLRTNSTVWSWGCNGQGQLGHNTTVNRSSPVSVVGGFTDWCRISAGNNFSLALKQA
jgi:alpha-tubulin suppressor-like RCC1 family protein